MNKNNTPGLTDAQVEESRRIHGNNYITPPKRESAWKLFAEKFNDPIIRVLIIAALLSLAISFVHRDFTETIGIFIAIFLATGIGFWFEWDAQKKFDALNSVDDQMAVRIIRNGKVSEVFKSDIVVGDIVLLETGEEIPADGELIESLLLRVNESSLTGEPSITKTTVEAEFKKDVTYPSNHVMRSSTVLEGHGVMRVISVGDNTEFGKVAKAATEDSHEKTPLTKQLDKLAKIIGVAGFSIAALIFLILFSRNILLSDTTYSWSQITLLCGAIVSVLVSLKRVWYPIYHDAVSIIKYKKISEESINSKHGWGYWIVAGLILFCIIGGGCFALGANPLDANSWIDIDTAQIVLNYFMIAVTLIVVAVPEGLPMSVTLSLALNMRRMLKSNNLVRKMHACETMGAINIICTDKTGTLTRNQMRVHEAFFFCFDSLTSGSKMSGLTIENMATNSTAHLDIDPSSDKIKTIGNPTEAALLLWLHDNGITYNDVRSDTDVIDQVAFSTERKYMATMVDSKTMQGKRIIYIKGAPEIVLSKCDYIQKDDHHVETESMQDEIFAKLLGYQNQAMRTLGFAYKIVDSEQKECQKHLETNDFKYLGVVAISDPIRDDVPMAVKECTDAGIAVKIVTGDTPGTAKEIGRQIGLWNDAVDTDYNHLTGIEFESLSDEELLKRVLDLKIMSRARPSDKQRFVRLLQQCGGIVAVTGDGTNDAPALNYANVGLSMGTGTSVAKEASDITLLDDSFNSIATAVMWGRSLYKNIQRFILFQLTINVIAVFIVFLGALLGKEPPLTITQMLWVNIIMDTFAAGALASLPPDRRVMKDKPRGVNDFIITRPMAINIFSTGFSIVIGLMILLYALTNVFVMPDEYAMSMFFTVFVIIQFWNMFNAKAFASNSSSFKNLYHSTGFLVVGAAIIVGQYLIVTYGGDMFRTIPLSGGDWVKIICGTSIVLWIGEIFRLFSKRRLAKD